MKNIMRFSHFRSDPSGDGGNRRTCQITEIIKLAGFNVFNLVEVKENLLKRYFYGSLFFLKYRPLIPFSRYYISSSGVEYSSYIKALEQYEGKKLIVWEKNIHYVTPYLAKSRGFKLIALPHNLESFVTDHPLLPPLSVKFQRELQHLAQADAIFCISREEQWLLKLWGLQAEYLPYYPPAPILEQLLEIRKARKTSTKQGYLILGTALNPPTLSGMLEQVSWLKEIQKNIDFQIQIAGYGTEQLKPHCDFPQVNLLGSVTPAELRRLLINTKAVLVHQRIGVGALTRIPEMLVAGVPVISNGSAARSAIHYHGVHCYDDVHELASLLVQQFSMPQFLQRPKSAENRLISCLQGLV